MSQSLKLYQLVHQLHSASSSDNRQLAAWKLAGLRDAHAVIPLLYALEDKDSETRDVVERALLQLMNSLVMQKDENAVDLLSMAMTAVQSSKLSTASEMVEEQDEARDVKALELLIHALEDKEPDVRLAAVKALGKIGKRATRPFVPLLLFIPLLRTLEDSEYKVRLAAAEALQQLIPTFKGPATVEGLERVQVAECLIQALTVNDDGVRRAAAEVLGELALPQAVEPLLHILEKNDGDRVVSSATWIDGMGRQTPVFIRKAVLFVVKHLRITYLVEDWGKSNHSSDDSMQRAAVDSLKQLLAALRAHGDIRDIEPFLMAIKANHNEVRDVAAEALKQLIPIWGAEGNAYAVEPLMPALVADDSRVRAATAEALGKLEDNQVLGLLVSALEDDDGVVRHAAAEALGELESLWAVGPFLHSLKTSDPEMRRVVTETLPRLIQALEAKGDERSIWSLIQALGADHDEVRHAAAEALGKLGNGRAMVSLHRVLEDKDEEVRWAAAAALGQLTKSG